MANIQKSWAEVQYRLKNALGTAHGRGGTAMEMLKYSDTNRRIVSVNQAQWGAFMDLEYQVLLAHSELPPEDSARVWGWLPELKQALEKYQLTLDDGQDARNEFLETKMYEAKAQSNKGKNTLNIETSTGNNEGDNQ